MMTEKLRRRGLHVGRHYGVDPFSSARVGEIMTVNVISLPSTATVGEARSSLCRWRSWRLPDRRRRESIDRDRQPR